MIRLSRNSSCPALIRKDGGGRPKLIFAGDIRKKTKQGEIKMRLKKQKKTITMFGRAIPVTLIVALMLVGIGSAALVTQYFQTTGTVTVTNPLDVSPETYELTLVAGETRTTTITVTNNADVDIPANLVTEISPDDEGITVTYDVGATPTFGASGNTIVTITIATDPALIPGTYTLTTTATPI